MQTILKAEKLTKTYKNQRYPSLNEVSFNVMQGELIGIMGASGSGKTTLLNILSTIDTPTGGSITISNIPIHTLKGSKAASFRKNKLGFIFQEYFLLDSLTAYENIAVPLTLLKLSPKEIDSKIKKLADLFGITEVLKKYPKEMSGGQKQRVAAARAIVKNPPLIFADEPTGALDSASSTEVLKAIREASVSLGTTVLMVTHDPYAASYTDRILYFKDGEIISELKRGERSRNEFYNVIMAEFAKQDSQR